VISRIGEVISTNCYIGFTFTLLAVKTPFCFGLFQSVTVDALPNDSISLYLFFLINCDGRFSVFQCLFDCNILQRNGATPSCRSANKSMQIFITS